MKKLILLASSILISSLAFSGSISDREKHAVRNFLDHGSYVDCIDAYSEHTIIPTDKIISIELDGSTVKIKNTVSGNKTVKWNVIANDENRNLIIIEAGKNVPSVKKSLHSFMQSHR